MTTAATARPGVDYRMARRDPILRGLVFTIPAKPRDIVERLRRRARSNTIACRDDQLLVLVERGYILAHRHRFGRRSETGERYVSRRLVALPPDCQLRELAKLKTNHNRGKNP
jgi:hypothetical protein